MDLVNYHGEISLKGFCDHCGNVTFQLLLTSEAVRLSGETTTYTFCRCTICNGILMRRHGGDWNAPLPLGKKPHTTNIDFEQLWPPSVSFPPIVPERIRDIYDEARLVRRQSPTSFVVQIRRGLEATVNDRHAEGRTLHSQIEWLIQQGELPRVFGEMIHIARMIGNMGAHDGQRDVRPEDADVSDRFFRAVIEYIYVAPDLLNNVRALKDSAKP